MGLLEPLGTDSHHGGWSAETFDRADFTRFTAWTYPHACAEELELLSGWHSLLWCLDDVFSPGCEALGNREQILQRIERLMAFMPIKTPGLAPPPEHPLERALAEAMAKSAPGQEPVASHGLDAADEALLHRPARSDEELRRQIALQLKIAPGGKQTARNEVIYGDGTFVVTYALPQQDASTAGPLSAAAVADCPSGWFCFYDGDDYVYPRGKLSDRGWQDLAAYGWSDRINSVHNNTNTLVEFIQHFDYGNPANGHSYDYTLFGVSAGSRSAHVSPSSEAGHVYRY